MAEVEIAEVGVTAVEDVAPLAEKGAKESEVLVEKTGSKLFGSAASKAEGTAAAATTEAASATTEVAAAATATTEATASEAAASEAAASEGETAPEKKGFFKKVSGFVADHPLETVLAVTPLITSQPQNAPAVAQPSTEANSQTTQAMLQTQASILQTQQAQAVLLAKQNAGTATGTATSVATGVATGAAEMVVIEEAESKDYCKMYIVLVTVIFVTLILLIILIIYLLKNSINNVQKHINQATTRIMNPTGKYKIRNGSRL